MNLDKSISVRFLHNLVMLFPNGQSGSVEEDSLISIPLGKGWVLHSNKLDFFHQMM